MKDIDTDYDYASNSFYLEETNPKKPQGDGEAVVFDQGLFRSFKPDNSPTTKFEAKESRQLTLNAAIHDYVVAGGEITKCKPGKYLKYGPGALRPPAGSVGTSRENDLSRRRWYLPNLSPTDERDLLRGARLGEKKAADKLFKYFHKDILKISSAFPGPTHNELVAAGIEGFCYAVAYFDLRRNNGFHAYALRCIKGHVLDYIKEGRRQVSSAIPGLTVNYLLAPVRPQRTSLRQSAASLRLLRAQSTLLAAMRVTTQRKASGTRMKGDQLKLMSRQTIAASTVASTSTAGRHNSDFTQSGRKPPVKKN